MKKEEMQILESMCKPVVNYLKENYDPHCTVVITDNYIKLVRDEIGIPIETAQEVPVQEQSINDDLVNAIGEKIVNRIASVLKNC